MKITNKNGVVIKESQFPKEIIGFLCGEINNLCGRTLITRVNNEIMSLYKLLKILRQGGNKELIVWISCKEAENLLKDYPNDPMVQQNYMIEF